MKKLIGEITIGVINRLGELNELIFIIACILATLFIVALIIGAFNIAPWFGIIMTLLLPLVIALIIYEGIYN